MIQKSRPKQIINLTPSLSPELKSLGVVDIPALSKQILPLLLFTSLPTEKILTVRANDIVSLLNQQFSKETGEIYVLISAPQFFTPFLQETLIRHCYHPLYSYTVKTSEGFKHKGFIDPM
jgi:hypothetical protein